MAEIYTKKCAGSKHKALSLNPSIEKKKVLD
jgi:hypothetical protein